MNYFLREKFRDTTPSDYLATVLSGYLLPGGMGFPVLSHEGVVDASMEASACQYTGAFDPVMACIRKKI